MLTVEAVVFTLLFWYAARFAWEGFVSGRQMQIGTTYWPLFPVLIMVPLSFGLMLAEMVRLIAVEAGRVMSDSDGAP